MYVRAQHYLTSFDTKYKSIKNTHLIIRFLIFNLNFFSFQTASSSGDPHTHNIKKVAATDEGLYTCVAGNVLGQAVASAYLEVNSANRPFALTPAKLFVQTTKHIQMHPFSTATTLLVLSTIYAQINRHAWPWFSI